MENKLTFNTNYNEAVAEMSWSAIMWFGPLYTNLQVEIVKENELQPTKLEEVAEWWVADATFGMEDIVDSMNKAKEHGFLGFRNSKNSLVNWIDKTRVTRLFRE